MTELNIPAPPASVSEDKDLDIWLERLVEYLRKYLSQPFERGDPAAVDFDVDDLTQDETWNDLDLSTIVPEDAVSVVLEVKIKDDAVNSIVKLRKNGNTNAISVASLKTQVADISVYQNITIPCDTSRVIEYYATNTTWTIMDVTVVGWFK